MNVDLLASLLLSLPIGIVSGLYSSLIITKYSRFSALRSEALRIVRSLNFMGEGRNLVIGGDQTLPQLPLVAGELFFLGHRSAGDAVSELYDFILGANIAAEHGQISVESYGQQFAGWQQKARNLSPSTRRVLWPFSAL